MRDRKLMMKLFNVYVITIILYCCVVWLPTKQVDISNLERIKKITNKIEEIERLKEFEMYSLERREK